VTVQVKWKGVFKIGVYRPKSPFISKTIQDTAIVKPTSNNSKMVQDDDVCT